MLFAKANVGVTYFCEGSCETTSDARRKLEIQAKWEYYIIIS